MKLLTDTWRQLVQRRLWPVALLLLGALVAVPFVLAKPAAQPVAPPAGAGTKATAANSDPIVAMVSADDETSTRRVLGTRHDPFASSAPATKPAKAKTTTTTQSSGDPSSGKSPSTPATSHDSSSAGNGHDASSGGGTSPAPTTDTPTAATTTIPAGAIVVRFGSSDSSDLTRQTLERLDPLTATDAPVAVFTGTKDSGKTAVFMLSDGVTPTGDGRCEPNSTCETIELKAGQTEFLDVAGDDSTSTTQLELDLVKIYKHKTTVPASQVTSSGTSGSTAG